MKAQRGHTESDAGTTGAASIPENGRRIAKRLPRKHGYTAKLKEVPAQFMPDWLERMDQRYSAVRTLRERFRALIADSGGLESLGYAQQTLAKRAIHLEALVESMEARLLRGDEVDVNQYTNALNCLANVLRTLGVKTSRRSRRSPADSVRAISEIGRSTAGGPPARRGR